MGLQKVKSSVKLGSRLRTSLVSTVRSTACHMEDDFLFGGDVWFVRTRLAGFRRRRARRLLGAPKPLALFGILFGFGGFLIDEELPGLRTLTPYAQETDGGVLRRMRCWPWIRTTRPASITFMVGVLVGF